MTTHIQLHASDVRERQIRNNPIVGPTEAWLVLLDEEEHSSSTPSQIIMAKHTALWISSSAASVYKTTTLAWHLPVCTLLNHLILDIGTKLQEISPEEILWSLELLWQLILTPHYECLDSRQLVKIYSEALEVIE